MTRVRHQERYSDLKAAVEQTATFEQLYQISIAGDYSGHLSLTAFCAGIRYAYGLYIAGVHLQPYIFALYQYAMIMTDISYYDGAQNIFTERETVSHGYHVGTGIDIGLLSHVGLFIECNYGYAEGDYPDGTKYKFDSLNLFFGVSYRTSYGLIE